MPNENSELEVVSSSALESMERASISTQVATAKQYPRELSVVKKQMLSFATLDEETAAGTFYTLPARKYGDKPIQGPSVRMAEIALSCYKNLRAGARIIADDGKQITAQGVCHDLENNVLVSVEVKRRVTKKDGSRYSEDMVIMTGNAACSIALRNATFRVIPLALIKPVYEQAKRVALGDVKTLVARRADSLAHFAKLGVAQDKVFAALQVKGLEDIGLEEVGTLIGYANAIKDGESTVEEIFSPKVESSEAKTIGEVLGDKKVEPAGTPSPEDPAVRKALIETISGLALDLNWTEAQLVKHAKELPGVPAKAKGFADLPSDALKSLQAFCQTEKDNRAKAEKKE